MKADITRDGAFTISDVWAWFEFIGCWPGNAAIRALEDTSLGRFFEISIWDLYGALAWTISVAAWLITLSVVQALTTAR